MRVSTGANVVILAPTAGGKTEAAFFPVISQMLTEGWDGLVGPLRQPDPGAAEQPGAAASAILQLGRADGRLAGTGTPARATNGEFIADPPDCLLTTPESLEAILVSSKIDHREFFKNVQTVVIDELHAFAGDDRGWHLLSVFARIQRLAGRDLQRIGLSATVGNPDEMLAWLSSGSERQRQVVSPPAVHGRLPRCNWITSARCPMPPRSSRCCTKARSGWCSATAGPGSSNWRCFCGNEQVETFVSHSSLGVEERRAAEHAFAQKQNCVIVATSSLELGLDVGDLDRVIQIDAPSTVSSFLQRMGRTGRRAGTRSNCLFLATSDEGLLRAAALLDLWRSGYVEPVNAPPKPFHILAQQLMALVLQERGIGRRALVGVADRRSGVCRTCPASKWRSWLSICS